MKNFQKELNNYEAMSKMQNQMLENEEEENEYEEGEYEDDYYHHK